MTKINQNLNFSGSTIYAGIDIHLKNWNVTLYCDDVFLKSFNQPPRASALTNYLRNNYPKAAIKVAYEAGFSGFRVAREFNESGIECIVVNAADVPQTDKGFKNKTDKNDSKRLAQALKGGMLSPIYIPDQEIECDRQLVRCNDRLMSDLTRAKNRVKGMLYQLGVEIPAQYAQSTWNRNFINWLETLELGNSSAKLTLQHQLEVVRFIRDKKLTVMRDIRKLLLKDRYASSARYIQSVPGVGPLTAAYLLTEIDRIDRFPDFKKLNCFVGFYPSQFSSGENINLGKISGRKHSRLRSLLIESAWTSVRSDPAMTLAYKQFEKKVGGKRAIIKVARKLLSRIRHVWIKQEMYKKGV
jgi:transposase